MRKHTDRLKLSDSTLRDLYIAFDAIRRRLARRMRRDSARALSGALRESGVNACTIIAMAFGITDIDWMTAVEAHRALRKLRIPKSIRFLYRVYQKWKNSGAGSVSIFIARDGSWAPKPELVVNPRAILRVCIVGRRRLFQVNKVSSNHPTP